MKRNLTGMAALIAAFLLISFSHATCFSAENPSGQRVDAGDIDQSNRDNTKSDGDEVEYSPEEEEAVIAAYMLLADAVELVETGEYDQSVEVLDDFIKQFGALESVKELALNAYFLRSVALSQLDDPRAALAACEDFLRQDMDDDDPDHRGWLGTILFHKALALFQLGDSEGELDNYRKVIELYNLHPEAEQEESAAAAFRNLAITVIEAGDDRTGAKLLDQMIEWFSDTVSPGTRLHLAVGMQYRQQVMARTRPARRGKVKPEQLAEEYRLIIEKHSHADDPESNEALARMMFARANLFYMMGKNADGYAVIEEMADRFQYETEGDIRLVVSGGLAQRILHLSGDDQPEQTIDAVDQYLTLYQDAWEEDIIRQGSLMMLIRINALADLERGEQVLAACTEFIEKAKQDRNMAMIRHLPMVESIRRRWERKLSAAASPAGIELTAHLHIKSTSGFAAQLGQWVEEVTKDSWRPITGQAYLALAGLYTPHYRPAIENDWAADIVLFRSEDGTRNWAYILDRLDIDKVGKILDDLNIKYEFDRSGRVYSLEMYRRTCLIASAGDGGEVIVAPNAVALLDARNLLASGWNRGGDFTGMAGLSIQLEANWWSSSPATALVFGRVAALGRSLMPGDDNSAPAASTTIAAIESFKSEVQLVIDVLQSFGEIRIDVMASEDGFATASVGLRRRSGAGTDGNGKANTASQRFTVRLDSIGMEAVVDAVVADSFPAISRDGLIEMLTTLGAKEASETAPEIATTEAGMETINKLNHRRHLAALFAADALSRYAAKLRLQKGSDAGDTDPGRNEAVKTALDAALAGMRQSSQPIGMGWESSPDWLHIDLAVPLETANALYRNYYAFDLAVKAAEKEYVKIRDGDPHGDADWLCNNAEPDPLPVRPVTIRDAKISVPTVPVDTIADPAATLIPFPKHGKWGYLTGDGALALPYKYDYARPFGAIGLAPVRIGYKWGFINTTGELALPAIYDDAGHFAANGLAPVKRNGAWRYIDRSGATAIDMDFLEATPFNARGFARVSRDGNFRSFMNKNGDFIGRNPRFAFSHGLAPVSSLYPNDKLGYINEDLELVIPHRFESAYEFSANGLASVRMDGKAGYIDTSGQNVIPCKYSVAHSFRDKKLAMVQLRQGKSSGYGYIDKDGVEIVPPIHDNAMGSFDTGYTAMQKEDKWGVYRDDGELVIPFEYDRLSVASPDFVRAQRDKLWGYITVAGDIVIPLVYDEIGGFGERGITPAKKAGKAGFIDRSGAVVIPFEYDSTKQFGKNGLAPVERDGKAGFIDTAGNIAIPFQFETAEPFFGDSGLAVVSMNGKFGAIDASGEIRIPCQYDSLGRFDELGTAFASLDRKLGVIRADGAVAVPLRYDRRDRIALNGSYKDMRRRGNDRPGTVFERIDEEGRYDYYYSIMDGKTRLEGIFSPDGEPVIPGIYMSLRKLDANGWTSGTLDGKEYFLHINGWILSKQLMQDYGELFHHGLARVIRDGKCGYIDMAGNPVIEPQYDEAWDFQPNGLALVRRGDHLFCINASGEIVAGQE